MENVTSAHHLAEASSQVVGYIKVNCWTAEKHLDGDDHDDVRMVVIMMIVM